MKTFPGLMAALALCSTACVQRRPPPKVETGPPALTFTLPKYPSGAPFSLEQTRGKLVLLDVWATWCEPCKHSLPVYEQLQARYAGRGLEVYALTIDEDLAEVERFLQEVGLSVPVLIDQDAKVAQERLRARIVPTSVLLDRTGRERFRHEGYADDLLAQYSAQIEALLKEQAP